MPLLQNDDEYIAPRIVQVSWGFRLVENLLLLSGVGVYQCQMIDTSYKEKIR